MSPPICLVQSQVLFRPEFVKATVDRFHYLHFGLFSFLLSGLVGAIISLATDPIDEEKLFRLTFWTRLVVQDRACQHIICLLLFCQPFDYVKEGIS